MIFFMIMCIQTNNNEEVDFRYKYLSNRNKIRIKSVDKKIKKLGIKILIHKMI